MVLYDDDSNWKTFGEEVIHFMRTCLLGDEELRNLWLELVKTTSLVDSTEALLPIFKDILGHYLNVADAQYRRSVSHRCQYMKTVEHRKQILIRSGSEVTNASGAAAAAEYVSTPAVPAPQPPQYCISEQGEYGKMILCESASCEVGWYHFQLR